MIRLETIEGAFASGVREFIVQGDHTNRVAVRFQNHVMPVLGKSLRF